MKMTFNEEVSAWREEFPFLKKYTPNSLYQKVGPFLMGLKMMRDQWGGGDYQLVLQSIPLWYEDLNKYSNYPYTYDELRRKNGAQRFLDPKRHQFEFDEEVEDAKRQFKDILATQIPLNVLIRYIESEIKRTYYPKHFFKLVCRPLIFEAELAIAVYLNKQDMYNDVWENIMKESPKWEADEFYERRRQTIEEWLNKMHSIFGDRDKFMGIVEKNCQRPRIAGLNSAQITCIDEYTKYVPECDWREKLRSFFTPKIKSDRTATEPKDVSEPQIIESGTEMTFDEVVSDWRDELPFLNKYSSNALFQRVGPLRMGLILQEGLWGGDTYNLVLQSIPLWHKRRSGIGNYPYTTDQLTRKNGGLRTFDPKRHHLEFDKAVEDAKEQYKLVLAPEISLNDLIKYLELETKRSFYSSEYEFIPKSDIFETELAIAVYLNKTDMYNDVWKNINRESRIWNPKEFRSMKEETIKEWRERMHSMFDDRDKFMEVVEGNCRSPRIAGLNSAQITCVDEYNKSVLKHSWFDIIRSFFILVNSWLKGEA